MARGRRLKSYLDYENALGDGIGVGYGQSYQPWLRAQDVKSRGNRSIVFGLKTFRNHHLLSSVESNFFYLAEFNDSVIDIREQFPLFPLRLTQQIANHLHFQHPMVRGVRGVPVEVLNVMTTDFLLTLRTPEGGLRYKALMNPLMILVKIIKLRWIHILSYDQMVSRKINNQTTRCANSIFYTTLFTNSAPNYT